MVQVRGLDHVVLNVADQARSLEWYRDKLGLEALRVDEWQRGEVFFPSVRIDATTIIDLLPFERTGENLNHLCVVIDEVDLDALVASGEFDVVSGPQTLWGAQGMGEAVYVRDPDGNTVELRYYR
jgi:catechol 2,3-dioxygenase-like lactoylglutathione lyase family enzyme